MIKLGIRRIQLGSFACTPIGVFLYYLLLLLHRRDDKEEQTVAIDLKPTVAGDGDNNSDRLMTTVSNDKTVTISETEMESLTCICDTFFPSINHRHESAVVAEFYQTSASMAGTPERIGRLIGGRLKHPKIWLVRLALWLLSTRIGTLILCGRLSISSSFPFLLSFPEIPLQKRERIVLSWSQSLFFHLRMLFKAFKLLIPLVFFSQVNEKNENLTWEAIGYPGSDPAHKAEQQHPPNEPLAAAKEHPCGPLDKGIINMHLPRSTVADSLQRSGFQVSATAGTINIKCDAVVVGSGSGGGVVAGMLANAGYKVLVLEKGTYLARSNLSLLEGPSMDQMYLQGGLLATDDMSFVVLAGSTVGGGSAINWSASIKTPHKVTQEWSHEHQLELFDTKMYREAMEVVCQKMGVHTRIEVEEGLNNTVLRKGCQRLGYPVEDIPRNADAKHSCGWCCFGCKEGRKLATSETWLVDLVNSGNGVILPGCEAVRVMHQSKNGRKIATGVVFESITKEICVVESKVTVVACGALSTPPLLRRSGLKNRHIGKNLHLHPVTMAWGYFNEEVLKQKSYQGPIITAMTKVTEDESKDDDGLYGAIIQTPSLHPGMFSSFMPWVSGSDLKRRMTRFSRTAHMFTLARDRGSGAVGDSSNSISYKMGESDERNLQKGVEKMLRILAAAGAEEIGTHNLGGRSINVKEVGEEELERFVKEESKKPIRGLRTQLGSAHQMGSCRMGVDPAVSAVKESGETWEVEGLYVADSSVFPTAVGVNPMVTVQAIAYCTALSVLERLRRKKLCSEF